MNLILMETVNLIRKKFVHSLKSYMITLEKLINMLGFLLSKRKE